MRDHFVELLSDYEKIALCQIGSLESGLSRDEVVSTCKQAIQSIRILRRGMDERLERHLYHVLHDSAAITDEDEAEMYAIAQKLASYDIRHDADLSLKIYEALLQRAREKHDDAKIIKYLYWCGITLFFSAIHERERILRCFEEGASYADRYRTFPEAETRQYIHRCLGNVSLNVYQIDKPGYGPEKAMALEDANFSFWNEILFSGQDLDFPWLNYFLPCLSHRHGYLTKDIHTKPDSVTREALQLILDNAIMMNKLYHKNRDSYRVFGETRYDFSLWDAQFHLGLISFDHLSENIARRRAEFAPEDFSTDAMYVKIQLSAYLLFYAAKMQKLKDRKEEILATVSKDVIRQFSMIPMSVNPMSVSQQLNNFVSNLDEVFGPAEHVDFVTSMSIPRHIPTYAHSIIVGKIALVLTKHLIKNEPEYFTGFMGIESADDVRDRTLELCHLAQKSGMCHDIGKISSVCNPYIQARLLTEEHDGIIRKHPEDGVLLLTRKDDSAFCNCMIDVIRGHHTYFDNSGGYPSDFDSRESPYRAMIHILSVADIIDYATDEVGYLYANPISVDAICTEIIGEAGRRFAPTVAKALEDGAVLAEIRRILATERTDAYYTAYSHTWAEDTKADV